MAKTENKNIYKITKLRFRDEEKGIWSPWEYEACSLTPNYESSKNIERGITGRHQDLSNLALELSSFPDITNAEFIPNSENAPKISLGKNTMTQKAIVTDDELVDLVTATLRIYNRNNQ